MEKAYFIVFFSFVVTFVTLKVFFGKLEATVKQSQIAPFNTVVEYFCSKAGTEYLITQNNALALHVDPQGMPVDCATQEPLAED